MRSFWLLLAALPALAEPCRVQTEERLASATTRFSIGSTTVAITVPVGFRVEFLTVYLEVSNPQPDLALQTGAQNIPIRDGSSFSMEPEVDERPTFAITDREGTRLCSWQPTERVWAYDPPVITPPAQRLHRLMRDALPWFFIAGDPLVLPTRSKTARDFTIDGEPARVLARTSRHVILRDPEPTPGFRTVKAQHYETIVAMVQVQKQLSSGALQITVTGPEVLTGGAALTIFSFNRTAAELHCGSAIHHHDWPDAARLPLTADDKGVFSAACPVKVHTEGDRQFDLVVQEEKLHPGQPALPHPQVTPRKIETFLEAQHG
jgi:hypothetical protein